MGIQALTLMTFIIWFSVLLGLFSLTWAVE
jgi:hypothetical protein